MSVSGPIGMADGVFAPYRAAAERNVGGLIEYGITAPGCAIAHSVTEIAEIGDIDHLVATPGCLWVVETKYWQSAQGALSGGAATAPRQSGRGSPLGSDRN